MKQPRLFAHPTRLLLVAFATLILGGCSEEPAAPAAPPPPPARPRPEPLDDVERALRAREPRDAYLLVPYGEPARAELEANGRQTFTQVLPSGLCYKLLGQAAPSITNLDLVLYDESGVVRQTDSTDSPEAQIGSSRPLCPEEPMLVRVEARATAGAGAVIVQWYVSP